MSTMSSFVTQMTLEMNSIIYYNADTLENGQIFLHMTIAKKSDILKLC